MFIQKAIYFGDAACEQYDGYATLSADQSYWIFTSLAGDEIITNTHELTFI